MKHRGVLEAAAPYGAALAVVAGLTMILWLASGLTDVADLSMVYLLPVLASAIWLGRGPAILAALFAFVAFNFFFFDPRYTLQVADSSAWIALVLLLISGLVVAQLAADQRERAREAMRSEREAIVLYDVVRLLGEPDFEAALNAVADRLRSELRLAAMVIELTGDGRRKVRAVAGDERVATQRQGRNQLAGRVLGQPPEGSVVPRWVRVVSSTGRSDERVLVVPVRNSSGQVGALTLVRHPQTEPFAVADDRLLLAVASQVALSVERMLLRSEATAAEVHRQSDVAKTALLNAASHDLRTPLASIVASAGSLLQEDVAWTSEERRGFASAIEQEATRLNRIVSNLLDMSRIEAGVIRPDRGWYDMGALVENVVGRLRPLAANHRVSITIPDDLPPVPVDYVQIDQVISNLLENALRHTPDGCAVTIDIAVEDTEMRITVTDNGPGLPQAILNSLDAARLEGARPARRGTRFGLSVVQGMIAAHGGRLKVRNLDGAGASFMVYLPLTAATGVKPPASVEAR